MVVEPSSTHQSRTDSKEEVPVSIVGYSLRAPNCSSVPEFAAALQAGQDLTTSDTRYPQGLHGLPPRQGRMKEEDLFEMNPVFFGMSRKQAERMDPSFRVLLKVSYEALMDALIDIESLRGSKTGVYAGHCFSDVSSIRDTGGVAQRQKINGYEILGTAHCMAANRLSYYYDLKGPSMTLDTACSSSLLALDRAAKDIKAGIIDRALVCGISLCLDHCKNAILTKAQMLSPTGHCHVFDSRADGYCRADGIACVVLERGESGYAQVLGTGTNQDGATPGITYPSREQQYVLMSEVFARSGVSPKDTKYHEAHGTGTEAGDQEEIAAMTKFYNHSLVVGSVKSNMGHSEGASGLMGLAKILLMFEDHQLYPNHDFQESPHEVIQSGRFSVLKQSQAWEPGIATISNFGFGGSNVFAILKPCSERKQIGKLPEALNGKPFLSAPGDKPNEGYSDFYGIHHALGNSKAFRYEWKADEWLVENSSLVFVCDGQGSQWNKMGQDLLRTSSVFRATMERLERETGIPLIHLYEDGNSWSSKCHSAIGITSFQLGIIDVLAEKGIKPDIFLGHSLGELSCAYLAGLQTQAEVLLAAKIRTEFVKLVDVDSRLDIYSDPPFDGHDYEIVLPDGKMQYVKTVSATSPRDNELVESSFSMAGKMIVVGCETEAVYAAISELELAQTCVACYNSPKSQTISGPTTEVDKLVEYLVGKNPVLFIRPIDTDSIAYHAPYLKVFREHLRKQFWSIEAKPLPSSWKSTSGGATFGVDYLIDNICCPVLFHSAIESLPLNATVVEVGPASGLLSQIKRTRKDLVLISLIEREKPFDLDRALVPLKPWMSTKEAFSGEMPTGKTALHYTERYPEIWGRHTQFPSLPWQSFEKFQREFCTAKEVTYDLTHAPWSSIRDHTLRGQNLFPAAGFLHVLWSANNFEKCTEIKDFRIVSPCVIPKSAMEVRFVLHRTGQYCEVYDVDNETCHARGHVSPAEPSRAEIISNISSKELSTFRDNAIDSKYWYAGGDAFGPKYRLLEQISSEYSTLKADATDFIAYVDSFFQQLSVSDRHIPEGFSKGDIVSIDMDQTVSFPRGADRVVFWKTNLDGADLWLKVLGPNSVGNSTVRVEGLMKEFARIVPKPPSIYLEKFVEYKESDCELDIKAVSALLLRESLEYSAVYPISSSEIKSLIDEVKEYKLSKEVDHCPDLVFADGFTTEAKLLVTTAELPANATIPCSLVARWGHVRLFRIGSAAPNKVVTDWEDVPETESFVWMGDGASGAAASLFAERKQAVLGYPASTTAQIVGIDKGMRHNFFLDGEKHGAWVDMKQDAAKMAKDTMSAQLLITKPGVLESMEWRPLDPEMYHVKIATATLNFRDIMRAMGMLKEQHIALGLEFSGYHLREKRRVFGLGTGTIASHCYPIYTYPTPAHWSDEEAATIPLVYLTAYYAMFYKADMKEGQSVLIHSGAGGLGMAAITLAQKRGIKVFTTCSAPKRDLLKKMFGLIDNQIGDSRSDSFVSTVLKGTAGRGVDVVLNHLAGDLQVASLRCVAPNGQFCELGKYDALINSSLAQGLLIRNVSFHVIDLFYLCTLPTWKSLFDEWLNEGLRRDEIIPLPTTAYDASEVVGAIRAMSQGLHTGKIVINNLGNQKFEVPHLPLRLWREGHLITGGLGGLGLALAMRLAFHGSRSIMLVGRRGVTEQIQRFNIRQMEALGCRIQVIQSNVVDLEPRMCVVQPDRIWHVATVYRDVTFDNMTEAHWNQVVKTKVEGYHQMRQHWPDTPIVNISSVSSYFGNFGQTNYAFANSSLDTAARKCSNTLTVRLGPLDNVGYVLQNEKNRKVLEMSPFELMPIADVLNRLEQVVSEYSSGVVSIYSFKPKARKSGGGGVKRTGPYTLGDAQSMLAEILGGQPDQYYPTLSLRATGLDSLSLMEVVHHIYEITGATNFKPQEVNEDFTVQDLVDVVVKLSARNASEDDDQANTSVPREPDTKLTTDQSTTKQENSSEASDTAETTGVEGSDTKNEESELLPKQQKENDLLLETTFDTALEDGEDEDGVWSIERKLMVSFSVVSVVWYIGSLVAMGSSQDSVVDAESILLYASVVFNVCLLIYYLVKILAPYVRDPIACAHYLEGILEPLVYASLFAAGPDVFLAHWESIILGRYMMDIISILTFWDQLVVDYRRFFMIHHILAFFCIGSWKLFPEQDGLGDNQTFTLGVMLWLATPIWTCLVMSVRFLLAPSLSIEFRTIAIPVLTGLAFVLERVMRLFVYIFVGLSVDPSIRKSYQTLAVLATGLLMDGVDIYFLWKTVRQQFTVMHRAREFHRHPAATSALLLRVSSDDLVLKGGEGFQELV